MIFTFLFSAVIQENISDDAVDLADKANSGLVTANSNYLSRIKVYIQDIMFSIKNIQNIDFYTVSAVIS